MKTRAGTENRINKNVSWDSVKLFILSLQMDVQGNQPRMQSVLTLCQLLVHTTHEWIQADSKTLSQQTWYGSWQGTTFIITNAKFYSCLLLIGAFADWCLQDANLHKAWQNVYNLSRYIFFLLVVPSVFSPRWKLQPLRQLCRSRLWIALGC